MGILLTLSEHDKRQNEINRRIRTLFNDFRRYIYEERYIYGDQSHLQHATGCYCYELYKKTLNINILDTPNETCKYWLFYDDQICRDDNLDYSGNFFMHFDFLRREKRIYRGTYSSFHILQYAKLIRRSVELLQNDEDFIVYFPRNEKMGNEAYIKCVNSFSTWLYKSNIVLETLDNYTFKKDKTLVFTIDFATNFERQQNIVNEVLKKTNGKGYVCILSLLKILTTEEALYVIENKGIISEYLEKEFLLYGNREKNKREKEVLPTTIKYDEEDLIMRSLSGHGADPEKWGF